jgi:hypothetical protein
LIAAEAINGGKAMHKPVIRIAAIVLASFALASLVGTRAWHSSSAQGAPGNGTGERSARVDGADRSKIQSLQRDLIETLGALRAVLEQQRQSGFVTSNDVLRANIELLGVELETSETNAARLVVLERIVEQRKELENNAARVAQRTQSDPTVLLRLKADSIKAEIDAERCRQQIDGAARKLTSAE